MVKRVHRCKLVNYIKYDDNEDTSQSKLFYEIL